MKTLAEHLKDAGIGQNEFARSQGIHPSTLSRYMANLVPIPLETAVKIKVATGGAVPVEAWVKREAGAA